VNLLDVFQKYGTDKGDLGYAPVYEALFAHRRKLIFDLLEIGIGTVVPGVPSSMAGIRENYTPGASLRAWRDYFPLCRVFGMDTQEDTMFQEPRITTILCDSTSSKVCRAIGHNMFNLIIDDGLHTSTAQIATLMNCWPYVRPGGNYIIEDVLSDYLFDTQDNLTDIVNIVPVFIKCTKTMIVVLTKPA
jgi:hypothetical protein